MALIAVDVTPMMPGGENGGVKILTLELLKSFQKASDHQFLVLTASWNHDELSVIDSPNMSRFYILNREKSQSKSITEYLPERLERFIRRIYTFIKRRFSLYKPAFLSGGRPLTSRGVNVLFCPFTAPTYSEPGIPVVSVIHDLQHKDYPQFFTSHEIDVRDRFMAKVKMKASHIICVSENVRQSVIKYLNIDPEITHVIHNCIQSRLGSINADKININLKLLGINQNSYMFYPANFWPHKNHKMLLTAYQMFLSRNPDLKIDLVLTGALDDSEKELKLAVEQMEIEDNVHFLGFLKQEEFEAVWNGADFLIFPSLYEGFGIPVLEAMTLGKPVICSNVTSLPEVAGNAALYFDPRKPVDIVQCMEKIAKNSSLKQRLAEKGKNRSLLFQPDKMTQKYLEIFRLAMKSSSITDTISGIFEDGWTEKEVLITYGSEIENRKLEIIITAPQHIPSAKIKLNLLCDNKRLQQFVVKRGETINIQESLIGKKGCISLIITPTFCPSKFNMGHDFRNIGVICQQCVLINSDKSKKILFKGDLNSCSQA